MATVQKTVYCDVYSAPLFSENYQKCTGAQVTLFGESNSRNKIKFVKPESDPISRKRYRQTSGVYVYINNLTWVSGLENQYLNYTGGCIYFNQLNVGVRQLNSYYRDYAEYCIGISPSYDSITFDLNNNQPYVIDTYDDIIPKVRNLSPSSFIDETQPSTFSWEFYAETPDDGIPLTQKNATIAWKASDGVEHTVSVTGSGQSYQFPANTFPTNAAFQWRIKVVSDDDISSEWSGWKTATTVEALGAVSNIYPNNVTVNGDVENRISWKYENANGTPQGGYEIQQSADGTTWAALVSETTADQYADIPAGAFYTEKVWIRIRVFNSSGASGAWSTSCFFVRAAPPMPTILSVSTNSDRPLIEWNSIGQELARITISNSQGECVYKKDIIGSEKSHRCQKLLADGRYSVSLLIRNEYNLPSQAAERQFTINTATIPLQPIYIEDRKNSIVSIDFDYKCPRGVLFRNGIAIADVSGLREYKDYTAFGSCKYVLRAIQGYSFRDSPAKTVYVTPKSAFLHSASDPKTYIELKFRAGTPPGKTKNVESEYSGMTFSGRSYPCFEFGEHKSESKSLSYSVRTVGEIEKIKELSQGLVIWRDREEKICGVISNLHFEKHKTYFDVSFTITKTDYSEEIDYEYLL